MRTTPKDVKQKRKTIAAAADSAGASWGRVTSRKLRHGVAPSVAAASETPRSRPAQNVPTMRTTTATLKNACAIRTGAQPRSRPAGREAREGSGPATGGKEREERERDDHGREHERHRDERPHDAPSPEGIAPEDVRGRQPDRERQRGGRERLPDGEDDRVGRQRIGEDVVRRGEPAAGTEAALEDGRQGVGEEEREERQRHAVGQCAPAVPAQRSTILVHSFTHPSRFASILSGGSSSGSSGTTANSTNSGGSTAPRCTGKTNIDSGTSSWKRFVRRKSTSFRAPSGFEAPRRTPANSICEKQLSTTTAVGACSRRGPR